MDTGVRVTVFCEHNQDRFEPVKSVYPKGMHTAIAGAFEGQAGFAPPRIATMDMPEHGLPQQVLDETDVLVWWSHLDNAALDDQVANAVMRRVLEGGMGFVALHSAIFAKPWQRLMGTGGDVGAWGRFRCMPKGERQRLWVTAPGHPITAGLGECFEVPCDEMYGEPQLIPEPDRTLFISWWEGGEVVRSGCLFERGRGRLFQFTPGHESFPIYCQPEIRHVLRNAALFLAPPRDMLVPQAEGEHLDNTPAEDLSHRL